MQNGNERRKEPRLPSEGIVELVIEEPEARCVQGRLMDISRSGFRASHGCTDLHSGQQVRFRHLAAEGRATAMWNRIVDGAVETGFLILAQ